MTDGIPDRLEIEIEEQDVYQDIGHLLEAMGAIRHIEQVERNITPEARDEYLHMSYRLASALEAVSDESILKNLETISSSMSKKKELLNYDFKQDGFWKEMDPDMDKALDRILIALRKENFSNIGEKHHVMQAAKYILSREATDDERIDIYSSILPFSTPSEEHNKQRFEKELKNLKIKNVETEERGLVLKIDNDSKLEKMVNEATYLGFSNLQLFTTVENFRDAEKKYKNVRLVEHTPQDLEDQLLIKNQKKEQRKEKISKIVNKTKFLTYPLIGMAPHYLQEKLESYVGTRAYDADDASAISALTKGGLSLAFLAFGGAVELGNHAFDWFQGLSDTLSWQWEYTVAAAGFVEEIVKAMWMARDSAMDETSSNISGKIAYLPLELTWRSVDAFKNRDQGDRKSCLIEIPLNKTDYKDPVESGFSELDILGKKNHADKTKENLVWSNKNHYSFGKTYLRSILRGSKKSYEKFKDLKNNALNIYTQSEVGTYHRLESMTCFKDQKYALSIITSDKFEDFSEMNMILKEDIEGDKKLSQIGELADAEFIRLIRYDNGIMKEDYEALK